MRSEMETNWRECADFDLSMEVKIEITALWFKVISEHLSELDDIHLSLYVAFENQFKRKGLLTDRQMNILEDVYTRVCMRPRKRGVWVVEEYWTGAGVHRFIPHVTVSQVGTTVLCFITREMALSYMKELIKGNENPDEGRWRIHFYHSHHD